LVHELLLCEPGRCAACTPTSAQASENRNDTDDREEAGAIGVLTKLPRGAAPDCEYGHAMTTHGAIPVVVSA
jgi:hypothetical protein